MRNSKIFWTLVVFFITTLYVNGIQHSLTLVSTQPQDTLEKEEPDKKSSSTLNHDQSMLLNTTALKKVIEQTQNSMKNQANHQSPFNAKGQNSNEYETETNGSNKDKLQSIRTNKSPNVDATLDVNQKLGNEPQKQKQHNKKQSKQPQILIQKESTEKINKISSSDSIKTQNFKEQQTIPNQPTAQKKQETFNTQSNSKKAEEKDQSDEKNKQKETEKSSTNKDEALQNKNEVIDKKQTEQKINNFKIDDIVPTKQVQSQDNPKPVLNNKAKENPTENNQRKIKETNLIRELQKMKTFVGTHQPETNMTFSEITPQIPITSLNVTLPKINPSSSILDSALKSDSSQKQKKQISIFKYDKEEPTLQNLANEKNEKSEEQKTKEENNKKQQQNNQTESTDSYVKWARDKALGTQNQNQASSSEAEKKTESQEAKKIEQKGKVMKNPKQQATPLVPEDKGKPKAQLQAKKEMIKEEHNIPDPKPKPFQKEHSQTNNDKTIQQNQNPDSHRTGGRKKSTSKTQQQKQRMKELMKMRKDRISKDEKAAKQLKSNNLKYQAIEKKIQAQKKQNKQTIVDKQKKSNILDKNTHLSHESPLNTKFDETNIKSKEQLQKKPQKNTINYQKQKEKVINQNRIPSDQSKSNDSYSQFLFQILVYFVLISIAVGIYLYYSKEKQPIQENKGSTARLRDNEEDEIEIAQRAEEDS